MILERREFLKLLGMTAGAAGLGGCGRDWLVPDDLVELALRGPGLESRAQTICGLCEAGCGVTVRLVDGLPVGLQGNPRHPLNRGGLCPVGQAGLDLLYAPERLQGPLRRGADGELEPVAWEAALDEVAGRLQELSAAGQGDRIAFLSGEPGQLLTDLARRFLGALGAPDLARLDGASALPYALTQGLDAVPGFDLVHADLVLSFGLDLYEDGPAPLHAIAAMVGSRSTERRGALVHVGTRLSPSASKAEQYVAVRPGSHAAFALGVAHVLVREGSYDRRFVAEHTFGFDDWTDPQGRQRLGFRRLLLERYYPDRAARLSGCDPARIIRVARRLATAEAPVVVVGGEAAAGSNATWTAIAVHALNALIGALGRPGGVALPPPIPLTPLADAASAPAAGRAPSAAAGGAFGADPVDALAEGVLDGSRPVEVLFVLGADPLYSSPAAERLRQALERIPLVVALAPFPEETAAAAGIVLPTPLYLESWQESTTPPTVPFSALGLGRAVVEPLFDSRHAGDVLLALAGRVGGPVAAALPWDDYAGYLQHRLGGLFLSGQGSVISGSFEESWVEFLETRGWRFLEHADPEAFWDDLVAESGWWNPLTDRGNWGALFRTPSGRFEFFSQALERRLCELGTGAGKEVSLGPEALGRGVAALGLEAEGDEACLPHYEPPQEAGEGGLTLVPFRPITGRGRSATASSMLLEMFGYPLLSGWQTWAELAPETAHELHLGDGDEVAVESDRGTIEAVVRLAPGAAPGAVHIPLGLGRRPAAGPAAGVGANPLDVVARVPDPLAGTLSLTSTRVRLRLVRRRPRGGPAPLEGGHG